MKIRSNFVKHINMIGLSKPNIKCDFL